MSDKNLLDDFVYSDAVQYDGGFDFPFMDATRPPQYSIEGDSIKIRTPEGEVPIRPGNWIAKMPGAYRVFTQEEYARELLMVHPED